MQLAILIVLILILVSISPWVLALAAAAVVAYGIWVVVVGVAFFVMVVGMAWFHGFQARRPVISTKTERAIERANEEFRRREAEQVSSVAAEPEPVKPRKLTTCRSCSASIEKFTMFCPVCGKKPI
ncbi:hypothetical protein [Pseudomonas xanthosomatis]|uniref:hypothetical protein n=1 Tax=Pseudomonas xanthosomatis TaxID=2842356 RepID=UPI00351605C2